MPKDDCDIVLACFCRLCPTAQVRLDTGLWNSRDASAVSMRTTHYELAALYIRERGIIGSYKTTASLDVARDLVDQADFAMSASSL